MQPTKATIDQLLAPGTADDDLIEYEGEKYSLSDFCKKFNPHKNWKSYQGPKCFIHDGKTLKEIRDSIEKA